MRSVRRPGLIIVLGLLAVAVGVVAIRARGPVVATVLAARTAIEQHVIASGRVRVVTRLRLSSQIAGRAVAVHVVEGQRVRAGDVLVQLDEAEARAAVAQVQAVVAQASGRVEQLRSVGAIVTTEASRRAATDLGRAESDLARTEKLFAGGVLPRRDLDEARRGVEIARARMTAAEAEQQASNPDGVDAGIATSALRESHAQLAGAMARLAHTRVVATQDGLVLRRSVEPGHAVQPGQTLLEIAADGDTELVIEPDERNLAWIQVGQRALASADTYPKEVFDAEVHYVAPAVDPSRGSIEVRLRVPSPPDYLKPDMTVSVDLTVATRPAVIALPSGAIQGATTPTPWVIVVEEGRIARRDVVLGIRGEGAVEVVSGIDAGTEVVLTAGAALNPGRRVRAVRGDR
jgi:HlyD family secretion protein